MLGHGAISEFPISAIGGKREPVLPVLFLRRFSRPPEFPWEVLGGSFSRRGTPLRWSEPYAHSVEIRQFLREVFPWALLPGGSVSLRGGWPEFPANRGTKTHRFHSEDVPWGEFPGGSFHRAPGRPEYAANPKTRLHRFYPEDVPWGEFPGGSVGRKKGFPVLPTNNWSSLHRSYAGEKTYPFPSLLDGWQARSGVRFPPFVTYTQVLEQFYRVADGSLVRYELYAGEGEEPDFSASGQPIATSPSLPFSWSPTPPVSGTKTLYLVVRLTNQYGLQSINVYSRKIVIDSTGAEVGGSLSLPFSVAVYDDSYGFVRVIAKYLPGEDRHPADTWEVFAAEGEDPIPGVSTAAHEEEMSFLGGEAMLSASVGPFDPGSTVHVVVSVKRSSDSERSSAPAVLHELITLNLAGSMFSGTSFLVER